MDGWMDRYIYIDKKKKKKKKKQPKTKTKKLYLFVFIIQLLPMAANSVRNMSGYRSNRSAILALMRPVSRMAIFISGLLMPASIGALERTHTRNRHAINLLPARLFCMRRPFV